MSAVPGPGVECHPDTLTTRYQVAYYTGQTGEPAAALGLYRELLDDQTRVLGADNSSTVLTRYRLVGALRTPVSWGRPRRSTRPS